MLKAICPPLTLLASLALATPSLSFGKDRCLPVTAFGYGQDQGEGQTVALVSGSPFIWAQTRGNFQIGGVSDTVAEVSGTVEFTNPRGSFTLAAQGSFDIASGQFMSMGPITAGTGAYAAVSGELKLEGSQNLETGRFVERVSGVMCWPG